jgi:alanine racemase
VLRDQLKFITSTPHTRPNWAEISASALRHNFAQLHAQAESVQAQLICVIKANAYGHDVVGCARVLTAAGASWFAVTSVDEGVALVQRLRQEGVPIGRILLLGGLYEEQDATRAVRYELTPVIFSLRQLRWLADAAHRAGAPIGFPFHLEIDTGMARQGVRWDSAAELDSIGDFLSQTRSIKLEALMTHFASPDDASSPQTGQQLQYFTHAIKHLYALGMRPPMLHAGNSVTLFDPAHAESLMVLARNFDAQLMVRPGLALYGYGVNQPLEPVLTWKTRVTSLRRLQAGDPVSYNATFHSMRASTIATLAVGYADGYNRLLSNKGTVLLRGERAPVVGRVTMDQTMVDVTNIDGVELGDEAVLLGKQGDLSVSAKQLASLTGTIPWEILCNIHDRVERIFTA